MDVQARLRACEERWGLRSARRLAGGCRADVYGCALRRGGEVVLKLGATRQEVRAEAAALDAWRETGVTVRLLDVEPDLGALLLERVRPGLPLRGDGDAVATGLLAAMHGTAPGPFPFPFPPLESVYPGLEQRARDDADHEQRTRGEPGRGDLGVARLGAARAAVTALCATTRRPVLLHGDFTGKNLLQSRTGYVACDPLPRIGDPCADVGFFAAGHPPATTVLARAGAIAERMDLDPHRARRWAAIWAVHQDAQAWRDDQRALDRLLMTDGFDSLLADG